jgi:hypothetical protein
MILVKQKIKIREEIFIAGWDEMPYMVTPAIHGPCC